MDKNPHAKTSKSHANNPHQQPTPAPHTNNPHQRPHQQQPTGTKQRTRVIINRICNQGRLNFEIPRQQPTPTTLTNAEIKGEFRGGSEGNIESFVRCVENPYRGIPIVSLIHFLHLPLRPYLFNELLLEQ